MILNFTILFYILTIFYTPFILAKEIRVPYLTARSAVIVRASDGAILYGKSPLLRLSPASTTKVMTALIVLEGFDLDKEVVISAKAVNVEPTKAGLSKGVKYTIRDLLKACLLSSANDAAVAIAEGIAGSEEEFAALMNKKAGDLGMKDTRFVNASGLPDTQKPYSTTYDLTILMRAACQYPLFIKMMNMKEAVIKGNDGKTIDLRNHNKMLWRKPGVIGKTGYTFRARHCFVGMDFSQDNPVAFAILGAKKPWEDIGKLLSYGQSLKK
jgi:D-alanyl-D-alanine carboxypeptidase (penicillin-binding protein 5/6)